MSSDLGLEALVKVPTWKRQGGRKVQAEGVTHGKTKLGNMAPGAASMVPRRERWAR